MQKNGKEFLSLDTNHAEVISSLHVQSGHLWSAGEYVLNCYESSGGLSIIDKFYYTCDDKINDMVIAEVQGQGYLNPILACQDKQIRVLNDRGDAIVYSHKFDSACTTLSLSQDISER